MRKQELIKPLLCSYFFKNSYTRVNRYSMATSMYKKQIAQLLERLTNASLAAREWKQVAENRHRLIVALDSAIGALYSHAIIAEGVLGINAPKTDVPLADFETMSADEAYQFALTRLDCSAQFYTRVAAEAHKLQIVLLDCLSEGIKVLEVNRPIADLHITEPRTFRLDPIVEQEDPTHKGSEHSANNNQADYTTPDSNLLNVEGEVPSTGSQCTAHPEAFTGEQNEDEISPKCDDQLVPVMSSSLAEALAILTE
jgi:hypothetical protein